MTLRRTSRTRKLPNGNRVTVAVGGGRRGSYKTVTVRRPDGTANSRTYRRGFLATHYLGSYSQRAPGWAKQGTSESKSSSKSGWKWFFAILGLVFYLFWPLDVDMKTVHGQTHVSAVGIILLCVWLPLAIGVPVLIRQVPRRRAQRDANRATRERHIAAMERNLGIKDEEISGVAGNGAVANPFVATPVTLPPAATLRPADLIAEIRDARAMVVDALRKLDAAEKSHFQTMSAWPVERPFSPNQIAEIDRSARRATAESEELSAVLDLRTRALDDLLVQAKAERVEVADNGFAHESNALRQSIRDSGRRIAALAQLYTTGDPQGA